MLKWIPNFPKQATYMVLGMYVVIALLLIFLTKGRLSYQGKAS